MEAADASRAAGASEPIGDLEARWERLDEFWQSTTLRIGIAVLAAVLLIADTVFTVRTIMGDPYWLRTTDAALYFNTVRQALAGLNPYAFTLNDEYRYYGVAAYDRFVYPPPLIALLSPLVLLGDLPGRLIWTGLVTLCLVGSVILLLRHFGRQMPWVWVAFILGLLGLSRMVRFDIYHAQVNYLLMILLVGGLWLYSRGRTTSAAVLLGILPVVKPFLGVLLVYFLWRRDWRTALTSALTSACLLLLSFVPLLISDPFTLTSWVEASLAVSAPTFGARPDHLSLQSLIQRLFVANPFTIPWLESPLLATGLQLLTLAGLAGLFLVAFWTRRNPATTVDPAVLLTETGLVLALMLTYGPATSGSHLQLLLPGIVGVVMLAVRQFAVDAPDRRLWLWTAIVWVLIIVLRASPVPLSPWWAGTAFGNPPEATWVPARGLTILLVTAQGALHLLAAVGLLALALRRMPEQSYRPAIRWRMPVRWSRRAGQRLRRPSQRVKAHPAR